jgi:hypothetical protein
LLTAVIIIALIQEKPICIYKQMLIPRKASAAIISSSDIEIKLSKETTTEHLLMKEVIKELDVFKLDEQIAELRLTTNTFTHNNAILYFVDYKPLLDFKTDLELQFGLKISKPLVSATIIYPHGRYNYSQSQWSVSQVNKIPGKLSSDIQFIDAKDCSLCLGTIEVYKDLGCTVSKELEKLSFSLKRNNQGYTFSTGLPFTGEFKTWVMVSDEQIADIYDEEHENLIRRADLNAFRKLEADGVYDKVPESYEPTDKSAFWRNPAQHVGRLYLTGPDNGYFRNIALLSMYSTLNNQNTKGYWPTKPKSLWLYNDYNIEGNFYDTRFSTDAAYFMLDAYQVYNENKALDAAVKYADFLVDYIRKYSSLTISDGYLVPDYMSEAGKANTHCSLNHLLAEMNFLYKMYIATENETYKETAELLKVAVKDTSEKWIKPNGDLWYCRLPDGTYGLQDYPTLTLNDLKESQQLFWQVYGLPDKDFQILIEAKEKFNQSNLQTG